MSIELSCEYCKIIKKTNRSLAQHSLRCTKNPNRIKYINPWTPEKRLLQSKRMAGINKGKKLNLTEEQRTSRRQRTISHNKSFWTDAKKAEHSNLMLDIVKNKPDSYSINNVSGRVKTYQYNNFSLKGKWELEVAKWLDKNNIKWTNKITPFEYVWKDKIHLYFPDFYLPEKDMYIEVKGYERERDLAKWKSVFNLTVIKQKEITEIINNTFNIAW